MSAPIITADRIILDSGLGVPRHRMKHCCTKEFTTMGYITVEVGSAIGLHARPANIIADTVQAAGVPVTLSRLGGEPVDAGSALMIMTLAAGKGTKVVVTSDHQPTLEKVAELVAADLDAD